MNVDIENVTDIERDMYTDFVRLLREKLPAGKTLAVAVAVNPWDLKRGWQASYDYKELAKNSDYLMLMAYDESYAGGPAGPVASYSFVEKSIQKALTEVPKEKLVLGIPFYGRYWKNGAVKGGYGLSNTDVEMLLDKYKGKVTFDQAINLRKPKSISACSIQSPMFLENRWKPAPIPFGMKMRLRLSISWIWSTNMI